ncbi:MAG: VOC family protein, partial [Mesorhizobium sp.]
ATVALVVANYDEAIAWYVERLGFLLVEDVDLGGGKRWITVAPANGQGARLLLAEASDEAQRQSILETDDFARDHAAMLEKGVEFREAPRFEPYGTVAVFADLHGNLWDLIEPKR